MYSVWKERQGFGDAEGVLILVGRKALLRQSLKLNM